MYSKILIFLFSVMMVLTFKSIKQYNMYNIINKDDNYSISIYLLTTYF